MKKFAAILLTVFMVISLAACGREEESAKEGTSGADNTAEEISTEMDSAENSLPQTASEPKSDAGTVETIPEGEQADGGADC